MTEPEVHEEPHPASVARRRTSQLSVESIVEGYNRRQHIRTFTLTAAVFAAITVAQVFGALLAHSRALLLDSLSMGVDAGTFAGNICVESLRGSEWHFRVEMAVGLVSLLVLIWFTTDGVKGALDVVTGNVPSADEEEEVNGWIVLAFALGGLIFDVVSLRSFWHNYKKTHSKKMNMWTALLHVGADLLRSTSTLVLSLVILCTNQDSKLADAWASLVVGGSILIIGILGLLGWLRKLMRRLFGCCKKKDKQKPAAAEKSAESESGIELQGGGVSSDGGFHDER